MLAIRRSLTLLHSLVIRFSGVASLASRLSLDYELCMPTRRVRPSDSDMPSTQALNSMDMPLRLDDTHGNSRTLRKLGRQVRRRRVTPIASVDHRLLYGYHPRCHYASRRHKME